jgi:hypothetical protein
LKFNANDILSDSLLVTSPGTYKAEFTSYSRCSASSLNQTIYNPISSMTSSVGAYVCDGSPTTLTTNANAAYTYQWKRNNTTIAGATTNSYVASQEGTYKVIVSDTNGCSDSPATFTINPLPTVALTSTGNCLGDTLITNVPDSTIAQITWYKDGQVVKAVLPEFDPIGEIVSGNNINGVNYHWGAQDIFVDDEGMQYISEIYYHRVLKFNPNTSEYTVVAGGNSIIDSIVFYGGRSYYKDLVKTINDLIDKDELRNRIAQDGNNWVQSLKLKNIVKDWEKILNE